AWIWRRRFFGLNPSLSTAFFLSRSKLRSEATRTRKNSSRLDEKIARNPRRSKSGTAGSAASWSTRALNESQLSSRFRYRNGDVLLIRSTYGRAGVRVNAAGPAPGWISHFLLYPFWRRSCHGVLQRRTPGRDAPRRVSTNRRHHFEKRFGHFAA